MKMTKKLFRLACWSVAIGGGFAPALSVVAATTTVLVGSGGLRFVPATASIATGDSVIWSWAASGHSTTSGTVSGGTATPDNLWNSQVQNVPHSFTNTFDTAGTFPYYCIPHAAAGMTGTIIVEPPTTVVQVGNGGLVFSPATASLPVHGRVIWNWSGTFHSTTSGTVNGFNATPDGLWDSGVNTSLPYSFTNTFDDAGTFPYYCSIHFSSGMTGTIIVTNLAAPNLPPTVSITNPANNITLSAPATFTLAANATDADGSIANVQFLQGATSLGNVVAAPFSISVNDLAAGDYTFSAVAGDNGGLTATNSITVHVINPTPVTISAPAALAAGQFQFSYTADIGLTYVVEISTNLLDWQPVATNTANANPATFTDANATGGSAFYRVRRQPNP